MLFFFHRRQLVASQQPTLSIPCVAFLERQRNQLALVSFGGRAVCPPEHRAAAARDGVPPDPIAFVRPWSIFRASFLPVPCGRGELGGHLRVVRHDGERREGTGEEQGPRPVRNLDFGSARAWGESVSFSCEGERSALRFLLFRPVLQAEPLLVLDNSWL